MAKKAVEVNTRKYEASHNRKPRGYGAWAFEVQGETHFMPTSSYSDAVKAAKEVARACGAVEVKVMP